MKIYFSDFFDVPSDMIKEYGAVNISLINDLPLFIDPFLLFNSKKPEYQALHQNMLDYLAFLRDKSSKTSIPKGLLQSWYFFPEVKQNWFGYSKSGNSGSGLGKIFANALHQNLNTIFQNFGNEKISDSSHLEKLCIIDSGVGRDNISDFTTNLIKDFLLTYTETFAKQYLPINRTKIVNVPKVSFNYKTQSWANKRFQLPFIDNDFIILTPRDILTKDDAWINRHDIVADIDDIIKTIPNREQRDLISNYFYNRLPEIPKKKDIDEAVTASIKKFPELLDHYIKFKEDNGDKAVKLSDEKVLQIEYLFIKQLKEFVDTCLQGSAFYKYSNSYEETYKRIMFLKQVIENNDGYKFFYVKGNPVEREADLQIIFRLTWFASDFDVNSEVNNGRGPVDYKISRGSSDKTLVEFKLAKNSKLKQNLANQVEIYEKANETQLSYKVILFFSEQEHARVEGILTELKLEKRDHIILIDARADNKPSASVA